MNSNSIWLRIFREISIHLAFRSRYSSIVSLALVPLVLALSILRIASILDVVDWSNFHRPNVHFLEYGVCCDSWFPWLPNYYHNKGPRSMGNPVALPWDPEQFEIQFRPIGQSSLAESPQAPWGAGNGQYRCHPLGRGHWAKAHRPLGCGHWAIPLSPLGEWALAESPQAPWEVGKEVWGWAEGPGFLA